MVYFKQARCSTHLYNTPESRHWFIHVFSIFVYKFRSALLYSAI